MVNMVPVARKSTPQPLKVLNPLVIRKVKNEPALPSPEWSIAGTQSVSDKEENGKVGQKGKGVEYEFYEECESYEKGEKYEDDEEDTAEKQDDTEEEEEENEKEKEKEKEKEEEMKKMDLPTFLRSLEERTFVDAPTATGLTTLRYEYEPLSDSKEAFRLLRLLPGPRTDPIQCDLCIEQIEGSPSYEAISYTWGDPNDTAEVLCNGRLLKVTKSLLGALQRFRHQEAPRTVWADAVCIDQGNLLERPEVMEPGDKVCVFFGYRAPVILKPHPTVDETYRFCGNCYIPELKDGQAIAMWKNGDIEEQNFKLL
ncbi:uncharacterized protein K452DRAFT_299457 [Aplosporella prunicola CBS 121167]|uniref:Heterokaryon incompatibility domain-containing protein n=1 Tax=Aplosporella prunicola CBS 121167 TaxID=1176127 RepID=A0A6A6BE28_9PEZI|nr:uncharacterized protein K452DRAFT_299457 [Aplosporella prunicola CBS 121167]KAF2140741.1 hypothetical protein K452DRAFT_299457 [Aplosporella prunicola CBS 121167]